VLAMTLFVLVLIVVAAFFCGTVAGFKLNIWFYIDACLDRGGSWNYNRDTCGYP
jgi:hypothetical protein